MTKSECPIEEYYLMHKVYKCHLFNMCNKDHKCVCRLNPNSKRGKELQNERDNS